jgi:hypothetical protein
MYDDLGTIYLPLLAKLFAIEKQNICGITRTNLAVIESEFRYLYLSTNNNEKYLIAADFFRKLGDILYYKNSDFGTDANKLIDMMENWGYDIKMDMFEYCYSVLKLKKEDTQKAIEWISNLRMEDIDFHNIDSKDELGRKIKEAARQTKSIIDDVVSGFFDSKDFYYIPKSAINDFATRKECWENRKRRSNKQGVNVPCYACKYYNRSLTILADKLLTSEEPQSEPRPKALRFLIAIREGKMNLRDNDLTQVALTMDSMGDLQICCADNNSRIRIEYMDAVKSYYEKESGAEVFDVLGRLNPLEKAVTFYMSSIEYYRKTSNYRSVISCYTKIFNLFTTYVEKCEVKLTAKFMDMMYKVFLSDAIRCAYYDRDFSTLTEWTDLRPDDKLIRFENMPIMPDIEEVLLAYYEIIFELEKQDHPITEDRKNDLRAIYRSNSLNYLRLESTTCARNISMLFKAKLNKRILDRIVFLCEEESREAAFNKIIEEEMEIPNDDEILNALSENNGEISYKEAVEFLITDSIFCLSNMIQFFTTTQRSTLYSNSFIGGIYERLLEWVNIKRTYEKALLETTLTCDEEEKGLTCFNKYFCNRVEESSRNILRDTYLKEMALRHNEKAVEMNSEGPAYQDFIGGMFVTDDDLQNDTCHFYLALERYGLNMKHTKSKEENLTERCYDGSNYFKDPRDKN